MSRFFQGLAAAGLLITATPTFAQPAPIVANANAEKDFTAYVANLEKAGVIKPIFGDLGCVNPASVKATGLPACIEVSDIKPIFGSMVGCADAVTAKNTGIPLCKVTVVHPGSNKKTANAAPAPAPVG